MDTDQDQSNIDPQAQVKDILNDQGVDPTEVPGDETVDIEQSVQNDVDTA